MAHDRQLEFFAKCFDAFPEIFYVNSASVVDIGSLDINGGPHNLIKAKYLGVDIGQGPNVNLVCPSQELSLQSESFDAVISSECLEHNPYWRETLAQMCRLSRRGGLVIFTCAGIGRAVHGTSTASDGGVSAPFVASTTDYYRNLSASELKGSLNYEGWFEEYLFLECFQSYDTYFIGIRTGASEADIATFSLLSSELELIYGSVDSFAWRRFFYNRRMKTIVEKYFQVLRFLEVVKTADNRLLRAKMKMRRVKEVIK